MAHLSKSQQRRKQERKQLATEIIVENVASDTLTETVKEASRQTLFQKIRKCQLITFLKDVHSELKRVSWPSKKDVLRWTGVVIVALLFFGILTLVLDQVITFVLVKIASLNITT